GNPFASIRRAALAVLFDKRVVACLLNQACDFLDGVLPRDILPLFRAGPPHLRRQQPPVVQDVLIALGPFRAKGATVDWMIRIAFYVHHLGSSVLGFVPECVDYYSTTNRAIWTRAPRLGCL